MTFQKGQSGNPSGRPKTALPDGQTLTQITREWTVEAVDGLLSVLRDKKTPAAARVSAAAALLDRGWGRPKQDLGIEIKNDESAAGLLERARQRAAEAGMLSTLQNAGSNLITGAGDGP